MTNAVLQFLEVLAGGLVNGLWVSVLLVALTAGLLRLIGARRKVNASTRYGVWIVTLIAVVAAHVVGAGLVGSQLDGVGSTAASQTGETGGQPVVADAAASAQLPATDIEELPPPVAGQEFSGSEDLVRLKTPDDGGLTVAPIGSGTSSTPASWVPSKVSIDMKGGLFLLAALMLLIWFSRMVAGLASVVSSWRHVRALKSGADPLDQADWIELVPTTPRRTFEVAESPDVTSPVAAGLRNPMILIPRGLRERLTTDEFRQVLMHEVAHIERFDDWTILIQRIGEALLWHDPAMWKVSGELQDAREIACDDWVVSRTRRPEAYVHSIGRMIELNLGTRSLQLAPGLAAKRGDLMSRMRRILNQKLPDSSRLSGEQIAVAGGLIGLVLVLVAVFVPLTRLAFSIGDSEAMTYIFGGEEDGVVQMQEVPLSEPLPPLAPLPALPDLPPLPDLPSIVPGAELSPPPPRAASARLREQPPPPPVSSGRARRADAPAPPVSAAGADLSVRSWIRILDSVSDIGSNGERTEVLRTALAHMPVDDRVVHAWLGAVNHMTSSGARSELLMQFVGTARLDSDRVDWIRSVASSIPSRGDRDRVLRALADQLSEQLSEQR